MLSQELWTSRTGNSPGSGLCEALGMLAHADDSTASHATASRAQRASRPRRASRDVRRGSPPGRLNAA
jgi:hypothetical protein